MGNRAQTAQQILEFFVAEEHRIAATEQHIADLRMLGDVGDLTVEFRVKVVATGVAHQSGSRAIAAVGRAPVGHQKEDPVGIAMHKAWHRRVGVFADRIERFPRGGRGLLQPRNNLTADGAQLIGGVDQVEVIRGNGHRQLGLPSQKHPSPLLGGHARQQTLQLINPSDAVLELPLPIVPFRVRDRGPTPLPCGSKRFQGEQLFLIFG